MRRGAEKGQVTGGGSYRWTAYSERGARSRNEDCWSHRHGAGGLAIWVLADGLGGHDDGDVAAQIAVNAFLDAAAEHEDPELSARSGMVAARKAVGALRSREESSSAPSSTLVGLTLKGKNGVVCHVGDSPLYQFRDGTLVHRTRDHNVRELKRAVSGFAAILPSADPDASKLTRSLGEALEADAEDVFSPLEVEPGDLLLLCSDGVSQHIPEDDPGGWVSGVRDEGQLVERSRSTVLAANEPRQDNYTAIGIVIESVGPAAAATRRPMWLAVATAVLALVSSVYLSQGTDPVRPQLADKARGTAGQQRTGEGRTQPSTQALGDPATAAPAIALNTPPSRSARPTTGMLADNCRRTEVLEERCVETQELTNQCRTEGENHDITVDFSQALPGQFPSRSDAEQLCRRRARSTVRRQLAEQCDGRLTNVQSSCVCDFDVESPTGASCSVSGSAECGPTREVCEEVSVPHKQCEMVPVVQVICDQR